MANNRPVNFVLGIGKGKARCRLKIRKVNERPNITFLIWLLST